MLSHTQFTQLVVATGFVLPPASRRFLNCLHLSVNGLVILSRQALGNFSRNVRARRRLRPPGHEERITFRVYAIDRDVKTTAALMLLQQPISIRSAHLPLDLCRAIPCRRPHAVAPRTYILLSF